MEAVLSDIGADAVKTGMLPTAACVAAVADALAALGPACPPLVVDPVLVATSGDALAAGGVGEAMVARLLPLATVVTPNLAEAAALLGRDPAGLASVEAMEEAAAALVGLGARWALVKGGHLGGEGDAVDVLHDGTTATRLAAPRVATPVAHGTGCTLASALAAGLARGLAVPAAAAAAKSYVSGALAASATLRLGKGPQFPMNHGYSSVDWAVPGWGGRPLDLGVYAVTDPGLAEEAGRKAQFQVVLDIFLTARQDLLSRSAAAAAAAAAAGGARVVQVRDKDGGVGTLTKATAQALAAVGGRAAVLVNDRVDAALAAGADGAHVGQARPRAD